MSKQSLGFNNTGVICWFNSLMQALISSNMFNNHFKDSGLNVDSTHTYIEIYNLITKITRNEDIANMSGTILRGLIQDLSDKKRKIDIGFGQQAPDEGLIFMLDIMNSKDINNLFDHVYEESIQCKETKKITSKKRAHNSTINVFDEDLLLEKGLLDFILFHHHMMEKEYVPEGYKDHQDGYTYKKTYHLRRAPSIIIILLNRFFTTNCKNFKPRNPKIKLPETFELPRIHSGELIYKKISEIDHTGGLQGGHYVSRCLRDDNVFLFNDISVTDCRLETLQSTFLTFYERIE